MVCRSVFWSVSRSLSVHNYHELQKRLSQSRCHLGCGVGCAKGTMYYIEVQVLLGEGHFWARWRRDFPAHRRAPFPVALTSEFPYMLSTSVPIGRSQKQLGITLNFPNETSPPRCGLSLKFFRYFLLILWVCSLSCVYAGLRMCTSRTKTVWDL